MDGCTDLPPTWRYSRRVPWLRASGGGQLREMLDALALRMPGFCVAFGWLSRRLGNPVQLFVASGLHRRREFFGVRL